MCLINIRPLSKHPTGDARENVAIYKRLISSRRRGKIFLLYLHLPSLVSSWLGANFDAEKALLEFLRFSKCVCVFYCRTAFIWRPTYSKAFHLSPTNKIVYAHVSAIKRKLSQVGCRVPNKEEVLLLLLEIALHFGVFQLAGGGTTKPKLIRTVEFT